MTVPMEQAKISTFDPSIVHLSRLPAVDLQQVTKEQMRRLGTGVLRQRRELGTDEEDVEEVRDSEGGDPAERTASARMDRWD